MARSEYSGPGGGPGIMLAEIITMAGRNTELTAADGHRLAAYKAVPDGQPKGGVVILQEIFGITEQMKRCTDRYAEAGYISILPALFDRTERDLVLDYTDFQTGGRISASVDEQDLMTDIDAARSAVAGAERTAVVGFCFGGTSAYLAACNLEFKCAVAYYGGGIGHLVDRMQPKVPVMYHFGGEDTYIPPSTIEKIRAADPGGIVHVYEGAGHGFSCDDRHGYHPKAASLAEQRTLDFLGRHL
jgi:carboxymethylenebutenolidase